MPSFPHWTIVPLQWEPILVRSSHGLDWIGLDCALLCMFATVFLCVCVRVYGVCLYSLCFSLFLVYLSYDTNRIGAPCVLHRHIQVVSHCPCHGFISKIFHRVRFPLYRYEAFVQTTHLHNVYFHCLISFSSEWWWYKCIAISFYPYVHRHRIHAYMCSMCFNAGESQNPYQDIAAVNYTIW